MEKRESTFKSHEEIMALFEELETLEQRLHSENAVEFPDEPALTPQVDIPADLEPTPSVEEPRPRPSKKHGLHQPHQKRVFKRQKLFDIEALPSDEVPSILSPHSTFILHLDEQGNLVGFDKPKPKPEPIHLSIRRKKDAAAGEQAEEPKGRLGKLKSLFRRKKSSSGEGSSKVSKVLGKFKKIGRRSKE